MGNRKLRQVDFKELWDYVENRSEDYGDFTKYLKALVQADKDKQDGKEAKTGKTAQRIIRKVENMSEDEQRKLYNFICEWC